MLSRLKEHLHKNLPFISEKKLLLAVSGGIDSMVLVDVFKQLGYDIAIAHCNFGLRGEESNGDEHFVRNLASKDAIPVFVNHFDTKRYAAENKISIQIAARELRYNWFAEIMQQHGYDYLLTAHHADDSAETFLINFTRGTGIEGLLGIPRQNGTIIRPLLPFTREEIETYAKENNVLWREDSSNVSDKYLRNKLRHHVLPLLKELNPSFSQSFAQTIENLRQAQALATDAAVLVYEKVVTSGNGREFINILKLLAYENYKAYLYQWLGKYGFTAWDDIYDLVHAQPGKFVLSGTHRLLKDRELLILEPLKADSDSIFEIKSINEKTTQPIELRLDLVGNMEPNPERNIIFVDNELIKFPLFVRRWQEGDYFCPLGMNGLSKKVSKFFKDEKMSLSDKENAWLLCTENEIIWVMGRRADDRFKVTTQTTQILKIEVI
ncbi:MAG: tRNA lysidine(34) synthetase TilS [Bacteroidia bacterium]